MKTTVTKTGENENVQVKISDLVDYQINEHYETVYCVPSVGQIFEHVEIASYSGGPPKIRQRYYLVDDVDHEKYQNEIPESLNGTAHSHSVLGFYRVISAPRHSFVTGDVNITLEPISK